MSKQNQTQNQQQAEKPQAKPAKQVGLETAVSTPFSALQRVYADPRTLSPADAQTFQRTIGNQALGRLILQRKMTLSPVGDNYEQEADAVAKQVVNNLAQQSTPQAASQSTTQRQEDEEAVQMKPLPAISSLQRQEEEELQMKPLIQRQEEEELLQGKREAVQRQEEEELQMKQDPMLAGGELSGDIEGAVQSAKSGGQQLDDTTRQPMEQAFGADFSSVKIHTGSQADNLNRSLSARAFTSGQDVFFRASEYNPGSSSGQELLAHELTHTVQQGASSLKRKPQNTLNQKINSLKNKPINTNSTSAIQRYSIQHKDFFWRNKYRVSDDGNMMVKDSETGSGAKHFYATAGTITNSNGMLTGVNSAFELVQLGETRSVASPDGSGKKTLNKVTPKNRVDNSQGEAMNTFDDCGTQAGMVMGHTPGVAVGKKRGIKYRADANYTDTNPANEDLAPDLVDTAFTTAVGSLTDTARDDTRTKMTGSATNARSLYDQMSEDEIEGEAKRIGVNQYAQPDVGEAYLIKKTGSRDTTGAKTKWDYHWGGVVARSGADTVTLENHGRPDSKGTMTNKEWYIRMYGSLKTTPSGRKDQTYFAENKASGEYGDTPITWRVGGEFV